MKHTNSANQDLRDEITRHGLFQWQIARRIGISEPQFTRWLREDLPEDDPRRVAILKALDDMEEGGEHEDKMVR